MTESSLGKIKNVFALLRCAFTSHDVTETEEDKLFEMKQPFHTKCCRCGMGIFIELDSKSDEYYYISEGIPI